MSSSSNTGQALSGNGKNWVRLMDCGAAAAKYVDAFMQNGNCEEVNRRFMGARKMAALI